MYYFHLCVQQLISLWISFFKSWSVPYSLEYVYRYKYLVVHIHITDNRYAYIVCVDNKICRIYLSPVIYTFTLLHEYIQVKVIFYPYYSIDDLSLPCIPLFLMRSLLVFVFFCLFCVCVCAFSVFFSPLLSS